MKQYEMMVAFREAIQMEMPALIRGVIHVQSRIDALSDYPTQAEVARAIGVSRSKINRYVSEGVLQKYFLKDSNVPRLSRQEIKEIIIREGAYRK